MPFQQCNDTVGAQFVAPASRPSVELLPGLIERGVDVLLFAGMWDVRRSYIGVRASMCDADSLSAALCRCAVQPS